MSNVCGVGGWSGPLPGDPDLFAPLTATPAFGGIDVEWGRALTNPHAVAHTLLYRSTIADFAAAVRIAVVGGNHYYDKLETLDRQYYWIQIVSINGTYGEVIGPATAIPRLSIDETIVALTGKIDQGVLAESLRQEIGNITSIGADLMQEIQDRIAANELLGAALQTAQNGVDSAFSLINDEITQRTTAYNILVQSLNTMAAQINDTQAAIQNEATLRIQGDEAIASQSSLLYAAKADLQAAVQTLGQAIVDGDDATASQLTTVQNTLGDQITSVQTGLQTNINTINGKVTDIGALYTAKVGVNGLIGGFGVYNDGTEVQAGFDVDLFWVGRTNADKKKPFIIDSVTGETYIDKAVIPTITADMIDTKGLTIKNEAGEVIFGSGTGLNWSLINSKPTSLSGINSSEGSKLSGIQAGATEGATIGSNLYRSGLPVATTDLLASWNKISTSNAATFFNANGLPGTYIQNLSVDKLVAGSLGVGQWISSTNYSAGSSGWAINANGSAEFNNVTVRGSIEASSLKANTAMVGTVHIDINAVTVPVSYYSAADYSPPSNAWATIGSAYINAGGSPVFVYVFVQYVGTEYSKAITLKVITPSGAVFDVSTTLQQEKFIIGFSTYSHAGFGSLSFVSTEAGTYTLQVHQGAGMGVVLKRRTLLLLGAKR